MGCSRSGLEIIAPHRVLRNRKRAPIQDWRPLRRYQRWWKIDRLFAWLQNYRRITMRYEYNLRNVLGLLHDSVQILLTPLLRPSLPLSHRYLDDLCRPLNTPRYQQSIARLLNSLPHRSDIDLRISIDLRTAVPQRCADNPQMHPTGYLPACPGVRRL